MPAQARALLAHHDDMTPTLERHHGVRMQLHVLARLADAARVLRRVVLRRADDGRPAEFGQIQIHLQGLGPGPRHEILESTRPLGAVLAAYDLLHASRPAGYFSVLGDALMSQALGCRPGLRLWGRANRLLHADGQPLAEVIEVLPPLADD